MRSAPAARRRRHRGPDHTLPPVAGRHRRPGHRRRSRPRAWCASTGPDPPEVDLGLPIARPRARTPSTCSPASPRPTTGRCSASAPPAERATSTTRTPRRAGWRARSSSIATAARRRCCASTTRSLEPPGPGRGHHPRPLPARARAAHRTRAPHHRRPLDRDVARSRARALGPARTDAARPRSAAGGRSPVLHPAVPRTVAARPPGRRRPGLARARSHAAHAAATSWHDLRHAAEPLAAARRSAPRRHRPLDGRRLLRPVDDRRVPPAARHR